MQSKKHSLLEAILNTFSGFLVTMLAQEIIYPIYGLQTSFSTNFQIAFLFTFLSITRSYLWRRLFNHLHMKGVL